MPDPGNLPVLTAADIPDTPVVQPTCSTAPIASVPAVHRPGPCGTLRMTTDQFGTDSARSRRTYAGSVIASEVSETWFTKLSGAVDEYMLDTVDNALGPEGRVLSSVHRQFVVEPPTPGYSNSTWELTDYDYQDAAHYSTTTWHCQWQSQGRAGEVITLRARYVIDALGKVIPTLQDWVYYGGRKEVAVTFHPNGVEASENWNALLSNIGMGDSLSFDDRGNPLQEDSLWQRAGTYKTHTDWVYDGGRLIARHIHTGGYVEIPGEPRVSDYATEESYHYEEARLVSMDSSATLEQCGIAQQGNTYVAVDCRTSPYQSQQTVYGYDSNGNLAERTVTRGGQVVEHWAAVIDAAGNLLCETKSDETGMQSVVHYDYGCFAP